VRRKPLQFAVRARDAVELLITRAAAALQSERRALIGAGPSTRLGRAEERLALTADDLSRAVRGHLRDALGEVQQAGILLGALSPLAVLSRGFAMVEGSGGSLVRSWRQAPAGTAIRVRLGDGEIAAQVTKSGKGGRDGGKTS
jgi:exodeoxyribonuclease VII large subunit